MLAWASLPPWPGTRHLGLSAAHRSVAAYVLALAVHAQHSLWTPHPVSVGPAARSADAGPCRGDQDSAPAGRTGVRGVGHRPPRRRGQCSAWGYPFRSQCLFWEAVPTAEDAAGESPPDPYLAEGLWGAAATQAFAGRLGPDTRELLTTPGVPRVSPSLADPLPWESGIFGGGLCA